MRRHGLNQAHGRAWLRRSILGVALASSMGLPGVVSAETTVRQNELAAPVLPLDELLPESTTLHPDVLAYAPLAAAEVRSLAAELSNAVAREAQSERAGVEAQAERAGLAADLAETEASLTHWGQVVNTRQAEVQRSYGLLGDFAVGAFVSGDTSALGAGVLGELPPPIVEINRSAEDELHSQVVEAEKLHEAAQAEVVRLHGDTRVLRLTMPVIESRWQVAEHDRLESIADIARLRPELERATILASVQGVGFPAVVLDAYYRAALATNARHPSCQVSWNQLAGIGQVETHHGTYRGSSVGRDGSVTPHILGIVLDGSRSLAIGDTDGGALDGDTVWDRAVGPMQFIPGSWSIFGTDGNGDGVRDPHNLYDAASSAGEHLCRSHSGLQAPDSFRAALLGYNRSAEYGSHVMSYAAAYGQAISLDRPPLPESVPEQQAIEQLPIEPLPIDPVTEVAAEDRNVDESALEVAAE